MTMEDVKGALTRVLLLSTIVALAFTLAEHANAQERAGGPQYNWTGFYLGTHAGMIVDGGANATYVDGGNYEAAGTTKSLDMSSAVVGLHGGYMHQFGHLVVGAEAFVSVGEFSGFKIENPAPVGNQYVTDLSGGTVFGVVGRLGVAIDRWQVYGKGGYAWSTLDFDASFYNKDGPGGTNGTQVKIAGSWDMSGPVFGAGVEYMVAPNVIIGVEYVRMDFGSGETLTLKTTNSGILTERVKSDFAIDTVMARAAFKF